MNAKIYAIYDIVGQMIVGQLQLFRHDAAAIRFFADVAADTQTIVARHIGDYQLMRLGEIVDDIYIIAEEKPQIVLSGKQWLALQKEIAPEAPDPTC